MIWEERLINRLNMYKFLTLSRTSHMSEQFGLYSFCLPSKGKTIKLYYSVWHKLQLLKLHFVFLGRGFPGNSHRNNTNLVNIYLTVKIDKILWRHLAHLTDINLRVPSQSEMKYRTCELQPLCQIDLQKY